jgi:hypothetical protein
MFFRIFDNPNILAIMGSNQFKPIYVLRILEYLIAQYHGYHGILTNQKKYRF